VVTAGDPTRELLLAEAGSRRAWWPFVEDLAAALPAAEFDTHVTQFDRGYCVTVTARTLVRDLALLADRVAPDAVVDDMLITLLPGESVTFETRTAAELTHEQLVDPLVLRSANQLLTTADQ
jgi:beta-mannosidase